MTEMTEMIDRRKFITGASVLGLAGLLGNSLLAKENKPESPFHKTTGSKWYKEEDFIFEGTPATKYLWPNNVLLVLNRHEGDIASITTRRSCLPDLIDAGDHVMCPPFDLRDTQENLTRLIRMCIDSSRNHHKTSQHLHVFTIDKHPTLMSIMVTGRKCSPCECSKGMPYYSYEHDIYETIVQKTDHRIANKKKA